MKISNLREEKKNLEIKKHRAWECSLNSIEYERYIKIIDSQIESIEKEIEDILHDQVTESKRHERICRVICVCIPIFVIGIYLLIFMT